MSFSKDPTTTTGDLIYCDQTRTGAPGRLARFAPNATASQRVLSMTSSTPAWTDYSTLLVNGKDVYGGTGSAGAGKKGEIFSRMVTASSPVNITNGVSIQLNYLTFPSSGVWKVYNSFVLDYTGKTSSYSGSAIISFSTPAIAGGFSTGQFYSSDRPGAGNKVYMRQPAQYFLFNSATQACTSLQTGVTRTLTASILYFNISMSFSGGGTIPAYGIITAVRIA